MTDKEKQIEEMAKIIATAVKDYLEEEGCSALHIKGRKEGTSTKIISKALFNAGYRKIPEGSVVMSKSEAQKYYAYKHIEPQIKGCLDREVKLERQLKEARKETAREFAKRAKEKLYAPHRFREEDDIIDEITKQFGVEVEE